MPDTSELGTTTGATPTGLAQAEPRASNNRLSLDLSDPAFDFVQKWEDGMDYTVRLRVTQISPGEFDVVSGTEEEGEAANEAAEPRRGAMGTAGEASEPNTSKRGGTGFRNPVLADIADEY